MGKSALTWKWFNEIAPQEMKPLAGRMWWSFYESDATFENFVIRALAYVTGRAREDVEKNTKPGEREEQLLAALDRAPFLLVLDGLERILIAYARMDAARLPTTTSTGRPRTSSPGHTACPPGRAIIRRPAPPAQDRRPRAGSFSAQAGRVRASRVLVSTRLYPADLQAMTGDPCPGCFALFLRRAERGRRAGAVARVRRERRPRDAAAAFRPFRAASAADPGAGQPSGELPPAPGDFERWRRDHPGFSPADLPLVQVRSHVLEYASARAGRKGARSPAYHRRVSYAGALRHPGRVAD